MMGCPSSDTTKAASTYTSTLLKYQQAAQITATTASFIIHPDSLSTFLSSILQNYENRPLLPTEAAARLRETSTTPPTTRADANTFCQESVSTPAQMLTTAAMMGCT